LANYWSTYNQLIPQRALGHQTPAQALKAWQTKKPELFVKRVQKQPGLDSLVSNSVGQFHRVSTVSAGATKINGPELEALDFNNARCQIRGNAAQLQSNGGDQHAAA
jgi:hypothetical protein